MKKIALTLLVVLVLGTFVACNGEVDSLLWEEGEKTLNLKFGELSYYTFSPDSSVRNESFEVPGSVRTWQDLINTGFSITVYSQGSTNPSEAQFVANNGYVNFLYYDLASNSGFAKPQDTIDFNYSYQLVEPEI